MARPLHSSSRAMTTALKQTTAPATISNFRECTMCFKKGVPGSSTSSSSTNANILSSFSSAWASLWRSWSYFGAPILLIGAPAFWNWVAIPCNSSIICLLLESKDATSTPRAPPRQRMTPEMNSSNVTWPSPSSNKLNTISMSWTSSSSMPNQAFTDGHSNIAWNSGQLTDPEPSVSAAAKISLSRATSWSFFRMRSTMATSPSPAAAAKVCLRNIAEMTRTTANVIIQPYGTKKPTNSGWIW
mmetsp:Transcript_81766/g.249786  ORF Transcript_81766/g.249786 Transcript_81766/m.249786 type:complete len:243 (-) Transcript_81766:1281-2009(-)